MQCFIASVTIKQKPIDYVRMSVGRVA